MKKIFTLMLLVCLAGSEFVFAQTDVDISLQIRPRFEMDGKDFNSDTGVNSFTGMRSRLGIKFSKDKNLQAFIQLQDTRIWGTEAGTLADGKNVDVHQAYVQINNLFGKTFDLKLGRMEAAYGPQRLIGSVGWHNIGRSFDGAVLKLKTEKMDIDFFTFQEVEGMTTADVTDKYFSGAYGNIKTSSKYKIQPFLLWQRDVAGSVSRFTGGAYVKGNMGGLFHEVEFAYQFGDNGPLSISAMMAALNVGYTFKSPSKPMLSAGIDYLSGDDNPADGDDKVFNTLYATNHKYYGFMDYFLNLPVHTYGLGLRDIHLKGSVNLSENFKLAGAFHVFNSNENAILPSGEESDSFGSEFDFTGIYSYNKNVKFQCGFSMFSAGDIFKEMKGEDTATWTYIMAVVNL